MATSTRTVVFGLSISEPKEEKVTRGKSYKFSLLNQSKIGSLWEIGHNFALKNLNQIRPVAFERSFIGLLQGLISDIEDPIEFIPREYCRIDISIGF